MNNEQPNQPAVVLSTAKLGVSVFVGGETVAWFAVFDGAARDWCTANHFGQWLTWRAKPPETVPLTAEELATAERRAEEMSAWFNDASNAQGKPMPD